MLDGSERSFGRLGFGANKVETLADGHAQAADALFIVHDQKAEARFVPHGLPIVFSTASRNSRTRNGFSTHGVPSCCKSRIVSALAVSPVMKIIREASSGRWRRT